MTDKSHWQSDKVGGREAEAKFLLDYLNALYSEKSEDIYHDSFVLNLNGAWGQGKSFFLTNLQKDIVIARHPVIYFDAWENDYSKSPLVGFLSELQVSLDAYTKGLPKARRLQKSFLSNGKKILGAIAGVAAEVAIKQLTGSSLQSVKDKLSLDSESIDDIANGLGESSKDAVGEIVQKTLDEHKELKELIKNLKVDLENIAKALHEHKQMSLPMYILVDELDRCRPTYAIELLENIKHIFSTSGIFFIIATNKEELAHSVSAVYGTGFDSFRYLKRFFNQEYTLSASSSYGFSKYLFEKYRIADKNLFTPFDSQVNNVENINVYIFDNLTQHFELSLRDKEQICIQLKSILLLHNVEKLHFVYLLIVLVLKHVHGTFINEELSKYSLYENRNARSFKLSVWGQVEGRSNLTQVDFNSVVGFYYGILNESRRELSKRLENNSAQYQQAILYDLSDGRVSLTPLSKYELLVQQAGHLG